MSVYRIAGGVFLVLAGLTYCGAGLIPSLVTGIFGVVAGVALLAGV